MLSCQVFVVLNLIKYTDHVSLGQLEMSLELCGPDLLCQINILTLLKTLQYIWEIQPSKQRVYPSQSPLQFKTQI